VQLEGGTNETYRVTLSEPIKDPIMALVSLGETSVPTTYDFDAPFTIVSQGPGYFGGSTTALEILPGDVLRGSEGSGTIQFIGTFSSFSSTRGGRLRDDRRATARATTKTAMGTCTRGAGRRPTF
jgi:hypothetical protein